jgi:RimJ/RimL family protein N-acetyltransferase
MPQPNITAGRLRLRPPELADAEVIFLAYAQDPEVTRYLIWRPHRSISDTQAFVRRCMDGWRNGTEHSWVITRAADSGIIGMMAARPDGEHRASVGYVLARAAWGQGYASEALRAVIEAIWMQQPQVFRIWAVCDVDNPASARVMEKAGMQREGRLARFIVHPNLSDEPRDVYLYAATR